jgi:hypothetical protein
MGIHITPEGKKVISIQRGITPLRRRYDHREPFFIRSALYCPGWGGHITKHSEQMVYICFGVFAYIPPAPHNVPSPFSTHHTWEFSAICSLEALRFGKKVSRLGRWLGGLAVARWRDWPAWEE